MTGFSGSTGGVLTQWQSAAGIAGQEDLVHLHSKEANRVAETRGHGGKACSKHCLCHLRGKQSACGLQLYHAHLDQATTLPGPRKLDDRTRIHCLGGSQVSQHTVTLKSEAKLWWWSGPGMADACGYSTRKHKLLAPYIPDKTGKKATEIVRDVIKADMSSSLLFSDHRPWSNHCHQLAAPLP